LGRGVFKHESKPQKNGSGKMTGHPVKGLEMIGLERAGRESLT